MEGGFEGGFSRNQTLVPKMVQDFVVYFYRHIRERNIREIYTMYSVTFPHLSERFFKGNAWPRVEVISHLVDDDHVFCILYKEMYYRHLYATGRPTLEQRRESWENYRELFSVILNSNLNMQLPNGWLWDMIDEFTYQFQSFLQYRGKLAGKSPAEIEPLTQAGDIWNAETVIAFLSELAKCSKIRQELSTQEGVDALYQSEGYSLTRSNVLRMLGYFSLIGLLKVHSVLGDVTTGMKAMAPLNPFERKGLFATKIATANITLFYYCGFGYLMMQRYLDAAKCFNAILSYISKVKSHHQRGPAYDQILKKNEQMYALLAMTTALCPASTSLLEESVNSTLREKYGEKMRSMMNGNAETFEELFPYACPKFASPTAPDFSNAAANTNQEAFKTQLKAFMLVVEERKNLPALKQVLKLYSSIPITKLASLAEMDDAGVRGQLDLLARSQEVVSWTAGDALQGSPQPAGDVGFRIEKQNGVDMVLASETKSKTVQGDFLVRHIQKFEDIVKDLDSLVVPVAQPAAVAAV